MLSYMIYIVFWCHEMSDTVNIYDKKFRSLNLLDMKFKIQYGNMHVFDFYIGEGYPLLFGDTDFTVEWKDKPIVQITIIKETTGIEELMPMSYEDDDEEFFGAFGKSLNLPLKDDTPRKYQYRLGGFYVKARDDKTRNDEEMRYFRGLGSKLLCFILTQIDASGTSILSLEAHGSDDPTSQRRLVQYYMDIGFSTCADLSCVNEIEPKYFSNAICMYGDFKTLWEKCGNEVRFTKRKEKRKSISIRKTTPRARIT